VVDTASGDGHSASFQVNNLMIASPSATLATLIMPVIA
jgi:hypothetical protein